MIVEEVTVGGSELPMRDVGAADVGVPVGKEGGSAGEVGPPYVQPSPSGMDGP